MELTREWVAAVTGGRVGGAESEGIVGTGIAFDSRALEPGQVFVALRDARDGHDFVVDAHARGAAFSIVDRAVPGYPVVQVADVPQALLALAAAARARLESHVVGITGSVGKTSTKDLTAAALAAGFVTHAAPASYNNEIGVPFTVLGAPESTQALVVEMGARFAGNIAALSAVARPEIGVITNIGITHAEHLGGPEGVAIVKGELLDALPATGLAVISSECVASGGQRARSAAPIITVGVGGDADVRVRDVVVGPELRPQFRIETPWGSGSVTLAVRGAHQAVNAAQAAAVALHLGVPFEVVLEALAHASSTGWRMQLHTTARGIRVLNDAYNASPVATLAAIQSLTELAVTGRRIAIIGDMRELGPWSAAEHTRIGAALADAGVDIVIAVGDEIEPLATEVERDAARHGIEVHRAADAATARGLVLDLAREGDAVLVKASRALGLEVVATALIEEERPA
jgi:UDP-N-acetylmuramoyl-tripeptide--D-alanyl-D-alanine ligase